MALSKLTDKPFDPKANKEQLKNDAKRPPKPATSASMPSVANPASVGTQATVKMPKAKGITTNPQKSLLVKSETSKRAESLSIGKLRDFLSSRTKK